MRSALTQAERVAQRHPEQVIMAIGLPARRQCRGPSRAGSYIALRLPVLGLVSPERGRGHAERADEHGGDLDSMSPNRLSVTIVELLGQRTSAPPASAAGARSDVAELACRAMITSCQSSRLPHVALLHRGHLVARLRASSKATRPMRSIS
jgi:hypothetical protein